MPGRYYPTDGNLVIREIDSKDIFDGLKNYVLYRYEQGSLSGGGALISVSNEFVSFKVNVVSE